MTPTYDNGELLAYELDPKIDLDDVVVFHPPRGFIGLTCGVPNEGVGTPRPCSSSRGRTRGLIVKRVVGLPGDTIAFRNGRTIRNRVPANEPNVTPCRSDDLCQFPEAITVPAGHYYVVGDRRGQSADSRQFGAIPTALVVGTVTGKG